MPAFNTIVPGFSGISLLSEREYAAIRDSVRGGDAVLELGTFDGVTAARLAADRPCSLIVSVDNFCEGDPKQCLANWFANHRRNQQLLIADMAAAAQFAVRRFDRILVDGAHDYQSALADLRVADRLAAPGGVIFAHDYEQPDLPHIAVLLAVDQFCAERLWRVAEVVDTMAILRQRGPG